MPNTRPSLATKLRGRLATALLAIALCLPMGSVFAQCGRGDWWTFGHDAQHTGLSSSVGPATPDTRWTFDAGGWVSSPTIGSDGVIYVTAADCGLYAINPDGSKRWKYAAGDFGPVSAPTIGVDGTIYTQSSSGTLRAIGADGSEKWSIRGEGPLYSTPAVGSDGAIYAGSFYGTLLAVDSSGTVKWELDTEGGALSSPALGEDGTIYVSSYCNKLFAVRPDGTKKWEYDAGESVYATPVIGRDGTIYVGSYYSGLHAINPDGSRKWQFQTGGTWHSALAIGPDGTVYAASQSYDGLYAINPDGSLKWQYGTDRTAVTTPAIDADGTIYVGCDGGRFYAINPDGSGKWESDIDCGYSSSPAIGPDGTIYIGCGFGLRAIGPGQTPAPPSVNISEPSVAATKTGPVTFAVSYSNASTVSLSTADIILNATGTVSGDVSVSGMEAASRTVTISNITGAGSLSISIAAGTASNASGGAPAAGPSRAVGVDNTVGDRGDWWMFGHDAQHTNRSSYVGPAVPYLKWERPIGLRTPPVIDGSGTIYAPAERGLYAISPGGARNWQLDCDFNDWLTTPAIGADGTVYLASCYGLRAISPTNLVWWSFGGLYPSPPAVGPDGTVYLLFDGVLSALDPDGTQKWSLTSGGNSGATPAIGLNGRIYAGCNDRFYAINPDGTLYWSFVISEPDMWYSGWSTPAIGADGTVYVGYCDGYLYAFDDYGRTKWETFTAEGGCSCPAIGADGTLYVGCAGMLMAIDANGSEKWSFATGDAGWFSDIYTPTIGADGTIYTASDWGILYAIDPDGTQKWRYTGSDGVYTSPVLGPDGTIYVGSSTGVLCAIGSDPSLPPAVSISRPSAGAIRTGSVSYTVSYPGSTSVSLNARDVRLNKTGSADGRVRVSGAGNVRTVTIFRITGRGTLGISLAAGTASNGVGKARSAGPSATVLVGIPASATISAPSVGATKQGPVSYSVAYAGADAVTLSAADVRLIRTGTADGIVTVSGSGKTTRTITVSDVTGDGSLGISIRGGTASNAAGSAPSAGPSATYIVMNTPPAAAISAPSTRSTKSGPVSYTITYSRASTIGLTAGGVFLNKTGTANGVVSVTELDATRRTVTISNITGDGTLGISLDADTAANAVGTAPGVGPSSTFVVTNTLPSVRIGAPSVRSTVGGPVSYAVTYAGAEHVSLDASGVRLNRTGSARGVVSVTGGGKTIRTVTISRITGEGTLSISLEAKTASNGGGFAPATGSSASFTVTNPRRRG